MRQSYKLQINVQIIQVNLIEGNSMNYNEFKCWFPNLMLYMFFFSDLEIEINSLQTNPVIPVGKQR